MTAKRKLQHRPLRPMELEVRAAEFNREGRHRERRMTIEVAMLTRRNGLTVGNLPRPDRAKRIPHQIDGFMPTNAPVRTRPLTDAVAAKPARLLVIFPGDARQLLTDSSWPWRLTGLVTTSDGNAGGVLVGDRLMLTAHHLRPSNSIAQGSWWMTFAPNLTAGTPLPHHSDRAS